MLLSAVSVLVVAQSSSEIPEGLMNNPVHKRHFYHYCLSGCEIWSLVLVEQTLSVLVSRVRTGIGLVSKAEEIQEDGSISEEEMGGKCSMYVRDGTRIKFLVRKLKERIYFEDMGSGKRIILKCFLNKQDGRVRTKVVLLRQDREWRRL